MKVSVILPCRNEEAGIALCIQKARLAMKNSGIKEKNYEILVSDASTDSSPTIANNMGARIVRRERGYGNAIITGLKNAKGKFLIFADADCSYDFLEIGKFISALKNYDFVIGNRFKGEIKKGAMPFLHYYLGNPFLKYIFNKKFRTNFSDTMSGFRGMTKEAFQKMSLRCSGMEFALEMLKEVSKLGLRVKEVPISYSKRLGKSKLRTFRDGFKHLFFILKQKK